MLVSFHLGLESEVGRRMQLLEGLFALCRGFFFIQYDLGEELGEGAFGKAYKAIRRRVRWGSAIRGHSLSLSSSYIEPAVGCLPAQLSQRSLVCSPSEAMEIRLVKC